MAADLDDSDIRQWRAILTLVVFALSNLVVLFPVYLPIFLYRPFVEAFFNFLATIRVVPPKKPLYLPKVQEKGPSRLLWRNFWLTWTSGPLIGTLLLLASTSIGRTEVYQGTIGANNIVPYDIVAFALSLGYLTSSIDASGIIRHVTSKAIKWSNNQGHRLFTYVYVVFFFIGCFFGNDSVLQMGTLFLLNLTDMSSNIVHPRAWIHTQFAIANIASAILVSSNTTNVVIAQAFQISFAEYTANLVVPVVITGILLMPFTLYVVFQDEALIPDNINVHVLPESSHGKEPVNPHIPRPRREDEEFPSDRRRAIREEVFNPFLDKSAAFMGVIILVATLVVLLALTAANLNSVPVFWVTLPASFLMLCWDTLSGWWYRHENRAIARIRRQEFERACIERLAADRLHRENSDTEDTERQGDETPELEALSEVQTTIQLHENPQKSQAGGPQTQPLKHQPTELTIPKLKRRTVTWEQYTRATEVLRAVKSLEEVRSIRESNDAVESLQQHSQAKASTSTSERANDTAISISPVQDAISRSRSPKELATRLPGLLEGVILPKHSKLDCFETKIDMETKIPGTPGTRNLGEVNVLDDADHSEARRATTLMSLLKDVRTWLRETFPVVSVILPHLPYSLVLFAFPMFILVQSLVSTGWVTLFAHGWDAWVRKAGTVGAVGGMGFLSVLLSNFAGTNIGATVLLSRVLQSWADIRMADRNPISDRTYWGAVYALAIGVNYGAFSIAFASSLAGMGWRDDLARRRIHVRRLDFARVNLPIIAFTMLISCSVLVGEVYIMRSEKPYSIRQ